MKHYTIYLASLIFSLFSQLSFAIEGGDIIWNKYPNNLTQFDYSGEKLKQHWSTLSAGPKIPWPDEKYVENMLKIYPEILERTVKQASEINAHPSLRYIEKKDFKPIALALQEVFRLHYQGEFQAAYQLGKKLGPLGLAPGLYSKLIHTTFLVNDNNLKKRTLSRSR